ncbi:MAG TPA: CPBP family intramembrane glutamic endopeptidase [Methylomirabilota bacterium]|nr:CPBP family intramembrane glutamic endopeptidase [Methylomirabilota bacterium]
MNEATSPMAPVTPTERDAGRRLVAPLWHTAVLIAALLAIAGYGAYVQSTAGTGPQLVPHRGSALKLYLFLIASEWGLLRFVTAGGLSRTGTRLRDLIGERWTGWKDVARDALIALAVWAVWTGVEVLLAQVLGKDSAKGIDSLLPRDPLEVVVWVALSVTAGFCEEAIFRGYLQRQFQALTGSALAAVAIQAVIFGVSHGYQGLRNVITISVFGAVFGALAWWRRSLKPGMILHAWTDVFSGIFAKRG